MTVFAWSSVMPVEWDDSQPIYRQLKDLVLQRIMDGSFAEGEAIPSVRQVAADYKINHLTVGKAYQELVDDGLLEKQRGLGMFVTDGARKSLLNNQQEQFLETDVPAFARRVAILGLDMETVIDLLRRSGDSGR